MLVLAIVIALLLLALSAGLSAAETAVMLLPPGRVHRLAEAERRGADSLEVLAELRHRLRAVTALAAALAFAAAAVAGARSADVIAAASSPVGLAPWVATGIGIAGGLLAVLLTFALAQSLPRTLAATNPERVGLDTARFALAVTRALYPVARVLGAPWKWAVDVTGAERTLTPWAVTPEWRGAPATEDAEREEAEEALLEAVSDFAEKVVREVMVPRTDVTALEDTATAADAIRVIGDTGYSRLPVYHDTVDDVRGVLYAKDLLVALGSTGAEVSVAKIARKPYYVPETKPVEELLFELRNTTHIAIVADEYGGTAGIVTLEDLLEEIVGDISDEYDKEEPLIVDLGEGRFCVDARLPVDDLNELFGTDIDIDADSVGGLFTEVAGRIPEQGESVGIEGLVLTVTDLQGTRIRQLRVEPANGGEGAADA